MAKKAYLVAMYRSVRDPAKLEAYAKLAAPAMLAGGGQGDYAAFCNGTHGKTLDLHLPDRFGTRMPYRQMIARLKKTITEFLERHPGSTFAELCREVPDFAGNATLGTSYQNLILWRGVSESAVRALELLEKGQYDSKTLATTVVPLPQMLEAYQQVADRTTITAIMTG